MSAACAAFADTQVSDVLIQELTHRFLNSLQVIDSLVSAALRQSGSDSLKEDTAVIRQRLAALADLHRRLTGGFDGGGLEERCAAICQDLLCTYGSAAVDLRLKIEAQPLAPGREGRLVLLLVELVTNALKHGLRGGGWLCVALRASGNDKCELVVANETLRPLAPDLGLEPKVAGILAQSLDARLSVQTTPQGRVVRVIAPLDIPPAAKASRRLHPIG